MCNLHKAHCGTHAQHARHTRVHPRALLARHTYTHTEWHPHETWGYAASAATQCPGISISGTTSMNSDAACRTISLTCSRAEWAASAWWAASKLVGARRAASERVAGSCSNGASVALQLMLCALMCPEGQGNSLTA